MDIENHGDVELCIRQVATQLQGLRVENGYRHTVETDVFRSFLRLEDLDRAKLPALAVGRTRGARVEFEQWLDDRGYTVVIPISIVGCLSIGGENQEDGEAASRAEALISDIVKMQMSDPKWGSPRTGAGVIKESMVLWTEHDADYDETDVRVEVAIEVKTVIDKEFNP